MNTLKLDPSQASHREPLLLQFFCEQTLRHVHPLQPCQSVQHPFVEAN